MTYTANGVINYLLSKEIIQKSTVVRGYHILGRQGVYQKAHIIHLFTRASQLEPDRYEILFSYIREVVEQNRTPQPVLRRIQRNSYHSNSIGNGQRDFVADALERIVPDADGVKRSFGIEYEIYSLTPEQEDKLATLLDTMPEHVTERDGSLSDTGVEIIFAPVDAATYISIVTKLGNFIRTENVQMGNEGLYTMAGMHTTYGVNNSEVELKTDLQIRLNRMALAVKSVATQRAIRELFGRDFGHYRELPGQTSNENALLHNTHGNAFSTNGRPTNCWENRLLSWNCNPDKVVEFFKATEFAFHRPAKASDFIKIFTLLGENTDGE